MQQEVKTIEEDFKEDWHLRQAYRVGKILISRKWSKNTTGRPQEAETRQRGLQECL